MAFVNNIWQDNPIPNITTAVDIIKYNNSITGDMFGNGMLILISLVLFIAFSRVTRDIKSAGSSTMLISGVVGFLMSSLGIVGSWLPIVYMIGAVISTILLYLEGGK